MKGWVYVMSSKAHPELVKVGFSTKDPQLRAQELDGTGLPHPFVVEYEVLVDEPRGIEQATHKQLRACHERKEFFRCSPEHAAVTIKGIVGNKFHVENFRYADRKRVEETIRQQEVAAAEQRRKAAVAADNERRQQELERDRLSNLKAARQNTEARYAEKLRELDALPENYVAVAMWGLAIMLVVTFVAVKMNLANNTGLLALFVLFDIFCIYVVVMHVKADSRKKAERKSLIAQRDAELAAAQSEVVTKGRGATLASTRSPPPPRRVVELTKMWVFNRQLNTLTNRTTGTRYGSDKFSRASGGYEIRGGVDVWARDLDIDFIE